MLVRFFSPILALARISPMLRTSVPPMSLLWAPKTCSTRARPFERVLLPCISRLVSGLLRRLLRWIQPFRPLIFQLCLDLRRPIGTVRPHTLMPCCWDRGCPQRPDYREPPRPSPYNAAPACGDGQHSRGSYSHNGSCHASWSTAHP